MSRIPQNLRLSWNGSRADRIGRLVSKFIAWETDADSGNVSLYGLRSKSMWSSFVQALLDSQDWEITTSQDACFKGAEYRRTRSQGCSSRSFFRDDKYRKNTSGLVPWRNVDARIQWERIISTMVQHEDSVQTSRYIAVEATTRRSAAPKSGITHIRRS